MPKNTKKQPESSENLDLSENTEVPNQSHNETRFEKPESTKPPKETNMKKELKKDEIVREKPPKKAGRPKKVVLRNEAGQLLKKDGSIDKRAEQGLVNLQKSKVYQKILENKKLKEETKGKVAVFSPIVDDDTSDDDIEFVIEEDPDIKAEKTKTEQYLAEQERVREKDLKEQLKKFEEENKKLKESFNYNSHLNRISTMASSVKLKF
jgi:hypothetical protein